MSLVLAGRVVPLSRDTSVAPSEGASFGGKVWIADDGRIVAVTRGAKKGPAGFDGAPKVDVGDDLILPGLIDLHSHLAYATLPLWVEPGRTTPFAHHDIWITRPTYAENVTWPAYAFIEAAPAELLAFAEVRALIGGTTSIQGSPPSNRPLDGWLVRNVEDERLGGLVGGDQVLASTLTMKPEALGRRAELMRQGATFIYHCAEGQPGSIVAREYTAARLAGCLQDRLVAIHTNALTASDYDAWQGHPGAIVWSPFSNLWLYGSTTDVPVARARNLKICLGTDWGPSGTRNLLGELKVAKLVSDAHHWGLTARDLVAMVTTHPGDVLEQAWGHQLGRLQPQALGDVIVVAAPPGADPFRRLLAATERDIRLVVIGGRPVYGTAALMTKARATATSALPVAGQSRRLALTRLDAPAQKWTFAQVVARLNQVRANPKDEIEQARRRSSAAMRAGKVPPLRLALDMPTGRAPIGGLPKDLGTIRVPPLTPLAHDRNFFASITGRGFHGGLLDGLAALFA